MGIVNWFSLTLSMAAAGQCRLISRVDTEIYNLIASAWFVKRPFVTARNSLSHTLARNVRFKKNSPPMGEVHTERSCAFSLGASCPSTMDYHGTDI